MQPVVLLYRPVDSAGESHAQLRAAGCDLRLPESGQDAAAFLRTADSAQALLGATFQGGIIDAELLEGFPGLRVVSKYTIGVDDVDLEAATRLGILVTHCPTEANWGGVAEGTLALMLSFLKKIRPRDQAVKAGAWRSKSLEGVYLGARGDGYAGITVGLVGLGRIGARVADLLAPWRVRIIAHDPHIGPRVFEQHAAAPVELERLLAESDVVSLHCNLTPETRGLINAARLAVMKPSALLINTARGAIVDSRALEDALAAGAIGGAALDVLSEEPPPADSRLLTMGERVILSPHMVAANLGGTLAAAIPWASQAVLAALSGEVPDHVYNAEAIKLWLSRFGGRSLLESAGTLRADSPDGGDDRNDI